MAGALIAKHDVTVDEFVKRRVLPEYRGIVGELRKLMRECAPDAREMISYGVPMYRQKRSLAVISPTKHGITLAFSRGADFKDKYGLLEGVGRVSKNVRMRDLKEANKRRFAITSNRRSSSTRNRRRAETRLSQPARGPRCVWHPPRRRAPGASRPSGRAGAGRRAGPGLLDAKNRDADKQGGDA
jgi:hypothetical protein